MSAPYPALNGTLMGSDITYLFIYLNSITDGLFVPVSVFSFWFIIFVGSMIMQQRFTARIRPEVSLAASFFAVFGYATILMTRNGLLDTIWYLLIIALMVISLIWVVTASD